MENKRVKAQNLTRKENKHVQEDGSPKKKAKDLRLKREIKKATLKQKTTKQKRIEKQQVRCGGEGKRRERD